MLTRLHSHHDEGENKLVKSMVQNIKIEYTRFTKVNNLKWDMLTLSVPGGAWDGVVVYCIGLHRRRRWPSCTLKLRWRIDLGFVQEYSLRSLLQSVPKIGLEIVAMKRPNRMYSATDASFSS